MTATVVPAGATGRLTAGVRDTTAMTKRNLHHYLRTPALVAVAFAQAVLFVVMFTYVFQGAIDTPGGTPYIDYLMGGIFVLAIAFGSINAGVGLAEDLNTGMIDRFRSLPMARPALLAGRTLADAIRNLAVLALMIAVGAAIGFRFHAGPLAALGAIALTVTLGYVLSWLSALIGLATRDTETAGTASLLPIIPLAFTSSTFVPVDTMPGWLQAWANINPITPIVDANRAFILGGPTTTPLLQAVAWISALAAIVIPLAIHRYQHATT
jgi:ABC transporter DrrB family efflux protein